jgi:hypothetical protein
MIVAVIALCLGLGGSAIAASDGVTKKQVKKIANKQIKKKAILKKNEGSLNVNSAKTATSATSAQTAGSVNGVTPVGLDYRSNSTAAETTIATVNGLQLIGTCASGSPELFVATTVNGAVFRSVSFDIFTNTDHSSNREDPFDVADGNQSVGVGDEIGSVEYMHPTAGGVSVSFMVEDEFGQSDPDCKITGVATAF